MIKIGFEREALILNTLPIEVIEEVIKISRILDEEYGEDRDMCSDMGGYSIIIESTDDFSLINNSLNIDLLNDVIPEYVDLIKCQNNQVYTSSLILCNNDFGITIIVPLEITPAILMDYISE
jgi:hypothetical protein